MNNWMKIGVTVAAAILLVVAAVSITLLVTGAGKYSQSKAATFNAQSSQFVKGESQGNGTGICNETSCNSGNGNCTSSCSDENCRSGSGWGGCNQSDTATRGYYGGGCCSSR